MPDLIPETEPPADGLRADSAIPVPHHITFNGVDGMSYAEFIQAIRQHAFDNGKSRDNAWIADLVALRFSGLALEWFEGLDDTTQDDWKLLKREITIRYANKSLEGNNVNPAFAFSGCSHTEAEELIQLIRRQAFAAGKLNDDRWMADLASTCLVRPALRWHARLSSTIRLSWNLLESALLHTFSPSAPVWGSDVKRIGIYTWNQTVLASSLRFPVSEDEWVRQGRARRAKISDSRPPLCMWYLVEVDERIPANAIPTGRENSGGLFSIRTWFEGGLALGKHGRHYGQGFIPWYGQEYLCSGPYEVLVGDPNSVRWVIPSSGPFVAIEGGFKTHSEPVLLIAGTDQDGRWQPGRAFSGDTRAYIGWQWKEHTRGISDVKILAWAD